MLEECAMRILLLTPPLTQLNTPYPATAYLTGFLRSRGYSCVQADPGIELVLRLFSREGISRIADRARLSDLARYQEVIEPVIRFLQGKDPSLALRICSREFLPEGLRFQALEQLDAQFDDGLTWAFGSLGVQDRAKYLASLMIDDLADVIREEIDPRFELSRYGEKLAASVPTFDPIAEALRSQPTLVDDMLDEITDEFLAMHQPDVIGMSVPFPG